MLSSLARHAPMPLFLRGEVVRRSSTTSKFFSKIRWRSSRVFLFGRIQFRFQRIRSAFEQLTRASQTRSDGAGRNAERITRIRHRLLFDVDEHEHRAMLFG